MPHPDRVEEIVAKFRKEFEADRGYGNDPQFVGGAFDINDYTDWLRKTLAEQEAAVRAEGYQQALKDVKASISQNHIGTFTDDCGYDCWYLDELVAHIATLKQQTLADKSSV